MSPCLLTGSGCGGGDPGPLSVWILLTKPMVSVAGLGWKGLALVPDRRRAGGPSSGKSAAGKVCACPALLKLANRQRNCRLPKALALGNPHPVQRRGEGEASLTAARPRPPALGSEVSPLQWASGCWALGQSLQHRRDGPCAGTRELGSEQQVPGGLQEEYSNIRS